MLAASCQDTEFVETLDSSKAQVMFSVAMDSPAARSRATWGDDYTPSDLGDEYDNRIDLDQFIVKIEAGGKTYNVTDIIKWKEGETNEYKFVGIVKNQNGENVGKVNLSKAKISVYANMGNDANANFATMTFNQDAENIPMWGALTVENLEFAPGKRTNVDDIYLLRAMAKFQVTLGEDAIEKGYTLTKASLNKFNLTGNNMPKGYDDAKSTMALDMEGVLNENTTNPAGVTELTEATEDGKGWVIYLPEISNTTASELKMLLTFSKGDNEQIETEVSVKDYTTANTGLVNIVRNHWYKYVIEDIVNAKPVVKYETLDWETININVGGEGFLALSTDLVEIYNANIGQLKFTSSSPITIVRADVYEHKNNGEIVKRQEINNVDPIDAYHISKFGQKIQLGTDPGFDVENKEAVLEKETQILNAISATCDEGNLSGDITINSPFVGHATDENCNYNTIRYIEFLVTNEDGLSATFRVMQYPPVVINNIEGYFSYREDFRVGNLPLFFKASDFTPNTLGDSAPTDNGEPIHFKNPRSPFFVLSGFYNYYQYEWDPIKEEIQKNKTRKQGFEEGVYGLMERTFHRVDEYKDNWATGVYHRSHYVTENGNQLGTKGNYLVLPDGTDNSSNYYQNVGPIYIDKNTGKQYRRHYTGESFNFFFSKYVAEKLVNGKSNIGYHYPSTNPVTKNEWVLAGYYKQNANHRIYHIRTTTTSTEYTIGWPKMDTDENGRIFTAEGETNSKMVSPSFMVASELGGTSVPKDDKYYKVPLADGMYEFAKRHCEQYAEAFYEDIENDGYTPNEDPITHYSDWRLPTKAELDVINNFQQNSRAMDQVLTGDSYFCSSITPLTYNNSTVLFDRRTNPQGEITNYYMRCVRDVKPGEKPLKKVYPI